MSCRRCGEDVAGKPVMRDKRTGLECCERCATILGGPSGFIRYIETLGLPSMPRQTFPAPAARPTAAARKTVFPERCCRCMKSPASKSWKLVSPRTTPVIKKVPICTGCKSSLIVQKTVLYLGSLLLLGYAAVSMYSAAARSARGSLLLGFLVAGLPILMVLSRVIFTMTKPGKISGRDTITFKNDKYEAEFTLLNCLVPTERSGAGPAGGAPAEESSRVASPQKPTDAIFEYLARNPPTSQPLQDMLRLVRFWIDSSPAVPVGGKLGEFMDSFARNWHVSWRKGTPDQVFSWLKECSVRDMPPPGRGDIMIMGGMSDAMTVECMKRPYGAVRFDFPAPFWNGYGVVDSAIEVGVSGKFHVIGKASGRELYYLSHR